MKPSSLDLMPPPFGWIDIPAGKVTLITEDSWRDNYVPKDKNGSIFYVPSFDIASYPVTNAQFSTFIEAGGYTQRQWWTKAGWQDRVKEDWMEPRYWQDKRFNLRDCPVVGVSWYEAVAFCRWLSRAAGENITLPTEQQWQRAAQGDDARMYPWGNTWDGNRCNHIINKDWEKNSTSPVSLYEEKGDSPFKVVDMAGNVSEWCLTRFETGSISVSGSARRAKRGGSWLDSDTADFNITFRDWTFPFNRNPDGGFRLARHP